MDMNQQPDQVRDQPTKPLEWTWIAQRQESDGEANSIWKFGFIAPDGAEVRVTFHEVGDGNGQTPPDPTAHAMDMDPTPGTAAQAPGQPPQAAPDQSQTPMAPQQQEAPGGPGFAAAGQPIVDQTHDASFYVTFFSNRHPEFFMKWDTSLSHEDSLMTWVTITHGIVDFVRKAKPANIILDDLSNGKLKMVLRSVAMDVATANPEYELQQTQKHHYRSFFEIKKKAIGSAFANEIAGGNSEGETEQPPTSADMQQQGGGQGGQVQPMQQGDPQTNQGGEQNQGGDKGGDPTTPQPQDDPADNPAFSASSPVPIKQTPPKVKGLTLEIGKDYSVALKDNEGNALDRYRGKSPSDILRWINAKNYGNNRMVIVDQEQLSGQAASKAAQNPSLDAPPEAAEHKGEMPVENFQVTGRTVRVNGTVDAKQAALMNFIINAEAVRCTNEAVEFDFFSDKDMNFKRALVELAYQRTITS